MNREIIVSALAEVSRRIRDAARGVSEPAYGNLLDVVEDLEQLQRAIRAGYLLTA